MRPLDRKKFFMLLIPVALIFGLVLWKVTWLNDHIFIRALIGGAFFAFVCFLRVYCQVPRRR